MADRKWNNQGGSSRDGGGSKGKLKKPSDPFKVDSVEDLKESGVTSFRLVKQRPQQPDYGQFGDGVWVPDVIIDVDPIRDLNDPYRFPDGSTDKIDEIKPFSESDNIKKVPIPNPNADFASEQKSKDLLPSSVKDEYELIVKFKKVILTILSGQAYAARNQLNDKKYDSSIVILSDNPIAMSGGASTVNVIQLVNGVQDPIDSLYDWMMTKTKIVTDGTGKNTDVKLLSISRQGAGKRLPETSFAYDGKSYGLFYVSGGIQPYQICMNARNDVLKFAAGNPRDDKYWSVLNANLPLSLCIANIPTVSIALAPGSAIELDAGGGMSFVLSVTVDPIQSGDTLVEYEILGDANSVFYTVTGTSFDSDGVPIVNIPNINNKTISIEPLANPSETEIKTIVFKLKENDRYLIDEELIELTILPTLNNNPTIIKYRQFFTSEEASVYGGRGYLFSESSQARFYSSNYSPEDYGNPSILIVDPFDPQPDSQIESQLNALYLNNKSGFLSYLYFGSPNIPWSGPGILGMPPSPEFGGQSKVSFVQIFHNEIRQFLDSNSFPSGYLFIRNSLYFPNWLNSQPSFSTISIQKHSALQLTSGSVPGNSFVVYDPIEEGQPYLSNPEVTSGYVEERWLSRTNRVIIGSDSPFDENFHYCIQINLRNGDAKFLSIEFSPTTKPNRILASQRPQIIQP